MKSLKLLTVCACVMALLVGCGSKDNEESKSADKYDSVMESKKLVLATSADYPPFEFIKMEDGKEKIVGYDIMIAEEIAKDLGVELVVDNMGFDASLEAIRVGKADMMMAGMDRKPEREKVMGFSDTYYQAEAGVLVRAEDADKYKSPEDMKGLKLGIQKGSTFVDVAAQVPDSQQELLVKVNDLVLALETGRVDAVLLDKPVAGAYAKNNSKVVVAPVALNAASEGYVAGFTKDSVKLKEAANKTIKRLKDEGKLDEFFTEANALAEGQ
ncbi:transporter substrate-binding domain-containing protein [Paenibacillus marinisediminis]